MEGVRNQSRLCSSTLSTPQTYQGLLSTVKQLKLERVDAAPHGQV
jgi:hypothetical protein